MNDIKETILALQFHKFIDEETGAYSIHVGKAIDALEKQIPKKPTDIDNDFNYFDCPSCGESIYSSERLETHKFCLECGQAIDWSVEE